MDGRFFASTIIIPWVKAHGGGPEGREFLLLCDSDGKVHHDAATLKLLEDNRVVVMFGPVNMTARWQPIVASIGEVFKDKTSGYLRDWLKVPKNRRAWGREGGLAMQMRRRLCLIWAGRAWKALHAPDHDDLHRHAWHATGCTVGANTSIDAFVQPQGMTDYSLPAP